DQLPAKYNDGLTKFVRVHCVDQNKQLVYKDVYMFMPSLEKFVQMQRQITKQAEEKGEKVDKTKRPSVLVLVLESTTRQNFLRSMPKTAEALEAMGQKVFYLK